MSGMGNKPVGQPDSPTSSQSGQSGVPGAPGVLKSVLSSVFSNLPAVLFLLLLVGAWQAYVSLFDVDRFILPSPLDIGRAFGQFFPELLRHTWVTTYEILMGFAVGTIVAVLMALLITSSRLAGRIFYPLLVASQTVPKIAIAPLFVIWFGTGLAPKVVIAAVVCFFPTVVNTVQGLRATDPNAVDLLRLVAASRWQVFQKLRFPNALPYFFAGLKISIALAVIGAVIGEWVGANAGLGYLIMYSTQTLRTDLMFAGLVLTALLGVALYLVVVLLERLFSWRSSGMPMGGL